jgi:hypothetical membrane protein
MDIMVEEEEEEVAPKERVVMTALKSHVRLQGVYKGIESIVQTRSRIESLGSSLFTMVLLRLMDQGVYPANEDPSESRMHQCMFQSLLCYYSSTASATNGQVQTSVDRSYSTTRAAHSDINCTS